MTKRPRDDEVPVTVLCFGDSNTWGFHGNADKQGQRMAYADRWTTILEKSLDNVRVIPEGLNGRTTCLDDAHNWANSGGAAEGANGRRYLLPCLNSHKPIDLLVLGLGCNDLKTRFSLNPGEIAKGCKLLVNDIKASGCGPGGRAPKIVLVSPPLVRKVELHVDFGDEREARSRATIDKYEELARDECLDGFVSLADVRTSEDGLHFDEKGASEIAGKVADTVRKALGR
eukprot:TRINITY_DN6624_c0_g1_i3.p1 TRINITY_DN6624_c0_g1~~TRINITY_DN6624_c0_g1_i3.p1  ORF type:complete len:229 (-),score=43.09 TRINITY_DN6624_c0_g1_i3:164-850(-)